MVVVLEKRVVVTASLIVRTDQMSADAVSVVNCTRGLGDGAKIDKLKQHFTC